MPRMIHLGLLMPLCLVATASARSQAVAAITEIWPGGLPGEEATVDWVEVTNLGDTPFNAFDELLLRSGDIPDGVPDGIPVPGGMFRGVAALAPGASAVFLTDYEADAYDPLTHTFYNAADPNEAIAAFRAVWGSSVDGLEVGYLEATFGGPWDGLDQDGETVYLFRGQPFETGSVALLDVAGYPSSDRASWTFPNPTIDTGDLSETGVDGAFEGELPANAVNANGVPVDIGLPPIGSPGVYVPEPATLSMGLAALGCRRSVRRRAH